MFCNQCQETAKNTGCTINGVCGKKEATSNLQDLLMYACQGLATANFEARKKGINTNAESKHIVNCLFMTITNANFDDRSIIEAIKVCNGFRDALVGKVNYTGTEDMAHWSCTSDAEFLEKATHVSTLTFDANEDIRSLKQYVLFGLKGIAAYVEHAFNLGFEEQDIYNFMEEALVKISKPSNLDNMLDLLMRTGEYGVKVMALLDKANTTSFGDPEMSSVNIGVGKNPGILISGHDLKDLEQLLIQTDGKGVDIYTHSEMLPSHAYPKLKKYKHLVGNYGNAWHRQLEEFETFNGPILFTTNCLVPPRKTTTYNDRVFTTGATGMPEWKVLDKKLANGHKDFSEIIEMAKKCKPPQEIEKGEITIGFAHNQVLSLADKILEAVNSGAIKRMVVMSGCDARQKSREYYTEFAKQLPKDTVILTSGCAKYRYNKLSLGSINGIPRVLDAGQCNDSYSWAFVALKLKEVLKLDDINKLPIIFNIAWYEQKAIIVHLALLYLGIKNTHIGPTLPAFITPNVLKVVQEKFGVQLITTVEEDMKIFELN
ncbi:hydroxylamine reductase [Williamwhitmania taraxaci]|uniref:Hydroxylamine reductase n=1 Tax=Williamwhitmania taraxaci TaxID=1640674 RepID=A0A1G6KXG4_9BACT|nr:hydroxylamine reductase [Williamwhitmania taraxaci]SDC35508.1 hydroxylamine reductase [Williamwhitmania taraxaci]